MKYGKGKKKKKKKFGESHSLARTGPYGDKVRNHIEIKEKERKKEEEAKNPK